MASPKDAVSKLSAAALKALGSDSTDYKKKVADVCRQALREMKLSAEEREALENAVAALDPDGDDPKDEKKQDAAPPPKPSKEEGEAEDDEDEKQLRASVRSLRAQAAVGNREASAQLATLARVGVVDSLTRRYLPPAERERRAPMRRAFGLDAPVAGIKRGENGRHCFGVVYESENIAKVVDEGEDASKGARR